MFDSLLNYISVIAVIVVLVVAHELGHFLAARQCKMRVHEFAVGFGNPKWTFWRKNGTDYTLRAIPAGGFVRIAGMEPGEDAGPDGFNSKSVAARMWVIFAGPLASFIFGYLLFCSIGMTVGVPNAEKITPVVENVSPGTEASKIGLQAGDRFVEINSNRITNGKQVLSLIESNGGKKTTFVVQRGDKQITLIGTPKPTSITKVENGRKVTQTVGKLGFTPRIPLEKVSLVESVKSGTRISVAITKDLFATLTSFTRLKEETGGPLTIIKHSHDAAKSGFSSLVLLMAALSINFAVINLVPIPSVLDGGHLLVLMVEAVRGKKLSERAMVATQMTGLAMIAVIIVLVLYKDITRLFLSQ